LDNQFFFGYTGKETEERASTGLALTRLKKREEKP